MLLYYIMKTKQISGVIELSVRVSFFLFNFSSFLLSALCNAVLNFMFALDWNNLLIGVIVSLWPVQCPMKEGGKNDENNAIIMNCFPVFSPSRNCIQSNDPIIDFDTVNLHEYRL
uniref:Uncharacterized protein n=1 Tax=Cacopsylla melanoneura TaxID=428564 RepID=A0A8D8THK3_9HEMI